MRIIRTLLAACLVAFAASAALAQTGGLTIRVLGPDGAPMPGATVTISNDQGFIKETAVVTNKNGLAEFPVLRPGGGYAINVSFPGMNAVSLPDLRVSIGGETVQEVRLAEQLKEVVKVIAERPVVNLEETQTSTKFSDNFIQDLPVAGRFYTNVLTMAPGVQDPDGDGNPVVHGSRSRDLGVQVGGISNVDPLTGQLMSRLNPNSIEEIEVITAGAGAEFGRAQGGYARVIQKQGSNEHEGLAEFIYQSSELDNVRDDSAFEDPDYDTFTPGVQFSGPIVRDKLWYILSHELRNIEEPQLTPGGTAVVEVDEATHSDQLTWQVSPRNKLAFKYRSDPHKTTNLFAGLLRPVESAEIFERTGEAYEVEWTAPQSPKVLVTSSIAWQDLNRSRRPTGDRVPNECISGAPFQTFAYCQDANTGLISGSSPILLDDHSQRFTARTDATWFGGRFWGMSHQFKFGLLVQNERYFRDLSLFPDLTRFLINDPTDEGGGSGGGDPQSYYLMNFRLYIPQTDSARATGTNWGLYAEDQIKPLPNLTLNLGLRVEREEMHSEGFLPFDPASEFEEFRAAVDANNDGAVDGGVNIQQVWQPIFTAPANVSEFIDQAGAIACEGVFEVAQCLNALQGTAGGNVSFLRNIRQTGDIDLTNTNIAPNFSLSWDPWNTGKTAIKLTAGRKYNAIPLTIPLEELQPSPTDILYRVPLGTTEVRTDAGVRADVNILTVDRDLRTPYADEFSIAFERELWTETSLTLTYINREYRDQLQDVNINQAPGDWGRCQWVTAESAAPVITSAGFCGDLNLNHVLDPGEEILPEETCLSDPQWSQYVIRDLFTGELYADRTVGPGDGRRDDCIGNIEYVDANDPLDPTRDVRLHRPDGRDDLYLLNPFWGDILLVGNFNFADYEAFQVDLVRRQFRSWEMQGSYVFSKSEGNGEDYNQFFGDDPSLTDLNYGYQSSDQRHVVKLAATTVTPWGIRLGGSLNWSSGLPFSIIQRKGSFDALAPIQYLGDVSQRVRDVYITGVRNDQRNDNQWLMNVKATKEMNLGRGTNLQVSAEVFNLLNDDTYRVYNRFLELGRQINGVNVDAEFWPLGGRTFQLGARLAF